MVLDDFTIYRSEVSVCGVGTGMELSPTNLGLEFLLLLHSNCVN
jgi:hypothetical protein